jgi:hypothetical protein
MAVKTLVNDFVQQLIQFVEATENSNGPFTLAMLVPGESGLPDKWNLVVSAKWIDDLDLLRAIPVITSALLKHLSKANVSKIERVSPLDTRDSITRDVVEEVEVIPGKAHKGSLFALTARGIAGGIILAARNPLTSTNREPQTVRVRG